jgi:hypothetical protein
MPVDVSGLSNGVEYIAPYSSFLYHTCAVLCTKAVKCWGSNDEGQVMIYIYMYSSTGAFCNFVSEYFQPHIICWISLETAPKHRRTYPFESSVLAFLSLQSHTLLNHLPL